MPIRIIGIYAKLTGLRIGQKHAQQWIGKRYQNETECDTVNKADGSSIPAPPGGILRIASAERVANQRGGSQGNAEGGAKSQ